MNDKQKDLFVITIIMIIFEVVLLSGCQMHGLKTYKPIQREKDSGYSVFYAQKGEPKFVFEYPDFYETKVYSSDDTSIVSSTSIKLVDPSALEEAGTIKRLEISMFQSTANAQKLMNDRLSELEPHNNPGMIDDFKVLESNRVGFSGIEGWESVCEYVIIPKPEVGFGFGNKPIRISVFDLVFSHHDYLCIINLLTDFATFQQGREIYEHTVKTFQFLD